MIHPEIEQKSSGKVLGLSPELGSFLMFGTQGASTPAGALNLYRQSTAVSIPINLVAEAFACIDPVIEIDGRLVTDHPVLDLLKKPSPFYNQILFMETIAKDFLITSESEIVAIGNVNRPPMDLQPISPANASVTQNNNGIASTITVSGNTLAGSYELIQRKMMARYIDGNLRELKQIRGYSSRDNSLLRGESKLLAASAEARQHIAGNTHNFSLLENGGQVSLIFHYENDMDTDNFNETQRRVREQYAGPKNAGKVAVSAGGNLKIETLGSSNKDMDYANLQKIAKQAVALQYKVPLSLVTVEASTLDNFKGGRLALYDDAVLPLADRLYGGLTEFLMPRYGIDPARERITYDKTKISALATRTLDELKKRKEINFESDNELRTSVGLEPYAGGDVILKPANLVPVGTDVFTEDEVSTALARDNNADG